LRYDFISLLQLLILQCDFISCNVTIVCLTMGFYLLQIIVTVFHNVKSRSVTLCLQSNVILHLKILRTLTLTLYLRLWYFMM